MEEILNLRIHGTASWSSLSIVYFLSVQKLNFLIQKKLANIFYFSWLYANLKH